MPETRGVPRNWVWAALLAAFAYVIIGLVSASLANTAPSGPVRTMWRASAFVISAIVFVAHIAREHFRLRSSPSTTALHTSLAVALGAFGLAAAAVVHSQGIPTANHRMLRLSLLIWPIMLGMPAYV